MAGKRLVLNGALKRTGNGSTAPVDAGLPRYAFIAHPACCPKCSMMDSKLTGRLYSVADTWRISHPNCCCATVEVPATVGMAASAVQAFATNPVGGVLRRGFNFGQSFAPTKLTSGNVGAVMANYQKNAMQTAKTGLRGNLARKAIASQRKSAYTRQYNKGKENWNNVLIEPQETAKMEKVRLENGKSVNVKKGQSFSDLLQQAAKKSTKMQQSASRVKVARERQEQPMFSMSGSISASSDVKKKKKKKKAQEIINKRAASKGTRDMAKLFGATIK